MDLRAYEDPARRAAVVERATGIDYGAFEGPGIAFDYEALMGAADLTLAEVAAIQRAGKVGETPLLELSGVTALVRSFAPPGRGATIVMKDEAANASGSFKARRAALSVHEAAVRGFTGVAAATSGNYGAAVASQAAMRGLGCVILQEAFDSSGRGQPEILEKGRACEAYGAEVLQLTVGPELFLALLAVLDETGYFSSSLYTPYSILGIETLGVEIAEQSRASYRRDPDVVVISHAGGGNLTGTARGLRRVGARSQVVATSVNLAGLHMASDRDFNRKSFTTSHTGFSRPFLSRPDRVDVPRSACRPLRYMDRFVTVEQGEVFYATEVLCQLDGLERGPAGNTALAAAIPLAATLAREQVVVVQESEYTGAGKSHHAQLTFARDMGVEVSVGHPSGNEPGRRIVLPETPEQLSVLDVDLDEARRTYVRRHAGPNPLSREERAFLAEETRLDPDTVDELVTVAT